MGLGPPVLALYRQLKGLGVFEGITDVMELGAQNVWCPKAGLVKNLFEAFGKPPPAPDMLDRFANWKGSGLELYTALGFTYHCIDLDSKFNAIPLDLNFDACPAEHIGKYGFVTNVDTDTIAPGLTHLHGASTHTDVSMSAPRVVITGLGGVTPIGSGAAAIWESAVRRADSGAVGTATIAGSSSISSAGTVRMPAIRAV